LVTLISFQHSLLIRSFQKGEKKSCTKLGYCAMPAELVKMPAGHYLLRSDTADFQFRGGAMKSFQYKYAILMISFIVLFFCISENGLAESDDIFYVTHVKGTILYRGKPLKSEDQLRIDKDQLDFGKDPDAAAFVFGAGSGCRMLTADSLKAEKAGHPGKKGRFVGFVRDCIIFPSREIVSDRNPFIPEEQMKAEAEFLILKLREFRKDRDEIRKEALGFLTDVYFGKSDENKAGEWLNQNFGELLCEPLTEKQNPGGQPPGLTEKGDR